MLNSYLFQTWIIFKIKASLKNKFAELVIGTPFITNHGHKHNIFPKE